MSHTRTSSPPAEEGITDPRVGSKRNSGEGAESVLTILKDQKPSVDELLHHGPPFDPDHVAPAGS
jgi:hypothetical protein